MAWPLRAEQLASMLGRDGVVRRERFDGAAFTRAVRIQKRRPIASRPRSIPRQAPAASLSPVCSAKGNPATAVGEGSFAHGRSADYRVSRLTRVQSSCVRRAEVTAPIRNGRFSEGLFVTEGRSKVRSRGRRRGSAVTGGQSKVRSQRASADGFHRVAIDRI